MKQFLSITWKVLLAFLLSSSLDGLTLGDWCDQLAPGTQLTYHTRHFRVVCTYQGKQTWTVEQGLISEESKHKALSPSSLTAALWQQLMILPIEIDTTPHTATPSVPLPVNETVAWECFKPEKPSQLAAFGITSLRLHVAISSELTSQGLPSPWPYLIQGRFMTRKWYAKLVSLTLPQEQ